MSLPTKRNLIDSSWFDSLTQESQALPNVFGTFPSDVPQTVSPTMLIRGNCRVCGIDLAIPPDEFNQAMVEHERRCQEDWERRRLRRRYEYETMYLYGSELRSRAMDMGKREETSASSRPSTPVEPSPSFTVPSSLSGDSLLTSFLSTTSAKNSGSNRSGSRSGLPKLLSSPSRAIPTKSCFPNSKKS